MAGDPGKRARGRPKTFDRDHTLDVAVDGYWREGIDAVSVNEICRRANISKPGLYREFGSEDRLLDAVLTRYYDTVLHPTLEYVTEDRPFQQTLDFMIDFATRAATSEVPAGCMFAKIRTSRGRLGPIAEEHVKQIGKQIIEAYSAWLGGCASRGELTLPASIETTASYVDAQMTMIMNRIAAGEDPEAVREHATLAFRILTGP